MDNVINAINPNKQRYAELFVEYVAKNYADKIDKIVVFGSSIDKSEENPFSIEFAIRLANEPNNFDYGLLGDLVNYMGEVVDKGDFNITFICDQLTKPYKESIKNGVCIYGSQT